MQRVHNHHCFTLLCAIAAISFFSPAAISKEPNPFANETPQQNEARMKWWREARFGMFIHWGVYSVPAGTYQGKKVRHHNGEWIMLQAEIPITEYKKFAKQFNPVKYDPDAWVRMAKGAGMKYIVITAKHHDGFALFDSKATDWDVVDATPYGKDLLKPLAEACRRHGMKLGFYYSQAQDWTHPGGATMRGKEWDAAHQGDMSEYINKIAAPQVKEILTNYGDIAVLWWDSPRKMNKKRSDQLLQLVSLQPKILTNNRLSNEKLGRNYKGDFTTPEQRIPATGLPYDWETCMTMNRTWGFKSYDQNWKPTKVLLRNLIDIVSKGGNYLLNVGPTPEGEFPEPSIERLREIGDWMKTNGESIYGTTASPFHRLPWGRCTKKIGSNGATLYLHVFRWPENGVLHVPGLHSKIAAAKLLDGSEQLTTTATDTGLNIMLPAKAPNDIASVVVLKIKGELKVELVTLKHARDGTITLPADMADLHDPGHDRHAKLEGPTNQQNIGYWTNARAWPTWRFQVNQPGTFQVVAEIATPSQTSQVQIYLGKKKQVAKVQRTGSYKTYEQQTLGKIAVTQSGIQELALRPVAAKWKPINLRAVRLIPVKE